MLAAFVKMEPVSQSPERPQPPQPFAGRSVCSRCRRPPLCCVCDLLPRVANRTPIVIVQHPRERGHPFNTVRLLEPALAQLQVWVDTCGRLRGGLGGGLGGGLPGGALEGCGLLYPGPGSQDLSTLPPAQRPAKLVAIDGTWHQARTLFRDIQELAKLPRFCMPSGARSAFRVRQQPAEHCLSTLESVALALSAFEPELQPQLAQLLRAFEVLNARQAAVPKASGRSRASRAGRRPRAIPRVLAGNGQDVVVAYAETHEVRPGERQIVYCVAERLGSGARFSRQVACPQVSASHLAHMQLGPSGLAGGVDRALFEADWRRFLRPADTLVAWNQSTLSQLCAALPSAPPTVALKAVYCNLGRGGGDLETIVAREGLRLEARAVDRASQRLDNALALCRLLGAPLGR